MTITSGNPISNAAPKHRGEPRSAQRAPKPTLQALAGVGATIKAAPQTSRKAIVRSLVRCCCFVVADRFWPSFHHRTPPCVTRGSHPWVTMKNTSRCDELFKCASGHSPRMRSPLRRHHRDSRCGEKVRGGGRRPNRGARPRSLRPRGAVTGAGHQRRESACRAGPPQRGAGSAGQPAASTPANTSPAPVVSTGSTEGAATRRRAVGRL